MQRYFHQELDAIRQKIVLIGEKASEAGRLAIEGFETSDLQTVERALAMDDPIDDLEVEIDRDSVRYISLRSPVSSDVRLVFVAIKISHDLERAGDEAHSIAKKTRKILLRDGRVATFGAIIEMSQIAFAMMHDAMTAFIDQNVELAKAVLKRDKEVDRLNKENFRNFSEQISRHPEHALTLVETILISKSVERIGDHAKNLAQEVLYLQTGH